MRLQRTVARAVGGAELAERAAGGGNAADTLQRVCRTVAGELFS